MPQAPDHLMKETLYMKIIHLLDRHRTWLEIESIGKATQLCPFWPRRIIPFG